MNASRANATNQWAGMERAAIRNTPASPAPLHWFVMWFAFDGHSFETFNTEAEAKKHADDAMDEWRDDASDGGWDELSTQVCYGKVTHAVTVTPQDVDPWQVPRDCDGCEEHTLESVCESVYEVLRSRMNAELDEGSKHLHSERGDLYQYCQQRADAFNEAASIARKHYGEST